MQKRHPSGSLLKCKYQVQTKVGRIWFLMQQNHRGATLFRSHYNMKGAGSLFSMDLL